MRPDHGPSVSPNGHKADSALQSSSVATATITPTGANFEGLSNQDNFNLFGFRVNPPDPVGDVGPNHYVEMVNLTFSMYSKTGTALVPPTAIGARGASTRCSARPLSARAP